jgi:Flp pilus assembly protein TadG
MKPNGIIRFSPARGNRQGRIPRRLGILRSQSGQSLIELALLTPLLLLLLIGTVEMGRFAYIDILVANAARAGAAYGAESLPQSVDKNGIQAAADADFQNNGITTASLSVNSSASCGCDNGGTTTSQGCDPTTNPTAGKCTAGHWVVIVSVTASGKFDAMFKFPGIPTPLNMSHTATQRVVQN